MKKIALFCSLVWTVHTSGQSVFPVNDSLDINNIKTGLGAFGNMWAIHPPSDYMHPYCFFPSGTKHSITGAGALWMSGYDGAGQLHIAAQTYRQNGTDYWPGPLNDSTLTYANSYKWGKIWKVDRSEIQAFTAMGGHDETNTPPVILTWPGKGNKYASGREGYKLDVDREMAPFIDLNGNGIYEPLTGEYPDVKGDQAAWWVFSDNGPSHAETNGRPLGLEVHAMAYGYKRNSLIDNVLFYEYSITNKSPYNYNNFRTAVWDDVELGYYIDDYIGCDASHRMGITYNAREDDGNFGGHPDGSYGTHIPIVGLSMIETPGDDGIHVAPAACFNTYNNDNTIYGNPSADVEYNNYMRSRIRNGGHMSNQFNGSGLPCKPWGEGPDCDFMYPGDPSDATQWSECQCNDVIGDRRFVLSSSDITFPAGATKKFSLALMVIADEGGCGSVSFTNIKDLADTVWHVYHNPLQPNGIATATKSGVNIYPNPANDQIFIESQSLLPAGAAITIYDITGRKMDSHLDRTGKKYTLDISNFAPGIYHLVYTAGATQQVATFVKN